MQNRFDLNVPQSNALCAKSLRPVVFVAPPPRENSRASASPAEAEHKSSFSDFNNLIIVRALTVSYMHFSAMPHSTSVNVLASVAVSMG